MRATHVYSLLPNTSQNRFSVSLESDVENMLKQAVNVKVS